MSRLLLALPGNEAFARRLAQAGGFEAAALHTRRFPDEERYVRIETDPAGRIVDLVCTLTAADDRFLTLAFAADALRDLGATEVNLIAPYLGYMRQDARFQPGEAVTSRTFARLVGQVVDRLTTVDPHLHRYSTLEDLYPIPCRTLSSSAILGRWCAGQVDDPFIVGPDAESEQWVSEVAAAAGVPAVVLAKRRLGDREVEVTASELSGYFGRTPVIIDDIASSGRTLVAASEELRKHGFAAPVCIVVHALFAGDALERVRAVTQRVVSTDTVPHETNAISIAPLIAATLQSDG